MVTRMIIAVMGVRVVVVVMVMAMLMVKLGVWQ